MRLFYSLKTAIIGLKTNKGRSFLTMLGIIIGIMAVVAMMSLGAGAENLIIGEIMSMGSNNIFIEPGSFDPKKTSMMEAMVEEMEVKTLKVSDAEAIAKLPLIDQTAPITIGTGRILYRDADKKITFLGTTPSALNVYDLQIFSGRAMTEGEVRSNARVVILGHQVKEDLFGDEDAIGKNIRIQRTNFQIIGVLEEKGRQMFFSLDEYIFLPVTSAQAFLTGTDHVNNIAATAINEKVIEEAIEDIRLLLRDRHNIYNPEGDLSKDDFRVVSQVEAANMMESITGIFTLFLSGVAAIALIVGGIGIMNIMMVSVVERTKEIGLRKAVGAKNKDILLQFLLEAVVLTIIGGILGVIIGVVFSFFGGIVLGKYIGMDWGFFVSLKAIILGFTVAGITGLVFGIYPARKAAKLDPIEALRYE